MQHKISSIAIALSLTACSGLKPFPAQSIWEFDRKAKLCAEYKIVQYDPKLQVKHLRDVPLEECPAIFGFSSAVIPKVLDWSEDALAYSKKRCK